MLLVPSMSDVIKTSTLGPSREVVHCGCWAALISPSPWRSANSSRAAFLKSIDTYTLDIYSVFG